MRSCQYRQWVRSLDCLVCSDSRGVDAAHTGPRGLGQKSSDYSCIPLCRKHHTVGNDSIHALGPRKFAEAHRLDIPSAVARLNAQWLPFESPHAIGRKQRSPEFVRLYCLCGWRSGWYRNESDALAAIHHHIEDRL